MQKIDMTGEYFGKLIFRWKSRLQTEDETLLL